MQEQLTEYSPSADSLGRDVILFPIESKNGVVLIPDRSESRLFNFYGSDSIHLNATNRIPLHQHGCWIHRGDTIFTGDIIGQIDEFALGDVALTDKTAVSCVPLPDVDAYLIYDAHHLVLSHCILTWTFNGNVIGGALSGWMLVGD